MDGDAEVFQKWLTEKTTILRDITKTPSITLTLEPIEHTGNFYDKNILEKFATLGSGVQIWSNDKTTPLSSWNLGKIKLEDGVLSWCYFLRTNIVDGIEPMKQKIQSVLN